jgi:hypothetical protein
MVEVSVVARRTKIGCWMIPTLDGACDQWL